MAHHGLLLSQNPQGDLVRVKPGDTPLPSCHLFTWHMPCVHVRDSEGFFPSYFFFLAVARWKGGMVSSLPARRFSVSEAGLEIL